MRPFRRLATALAFAVVATAASAADPTSNWSSGSGDKLTAARTKVSAKDWSGALDELRKVDDKSSADWNNLMGYSLRKADPARNVAEAERHYDQALRIDPKHRGALEYSGELHLMSGNLPMAERRLAALDQACFLPCEEYRDLKRAVERYRANGNKYVP